jgi:FtsP/CotA-like multicopper oxidase with cupredoxin domain
MRDIRSNTVLKVEVDGDPVGVNTTLPTETTYPVQPPYLEDITKLGPVQRTVTFEMKGGPGGPPNQPVFTIDGKQFQEGIIDQIMLMGGAEEWTLRNTSLNAVTHPFHIHVNPFQVTEVFDPSLPANQQLKKLDAPWIWWDTIAIPAGVADSTGKVTAGYIKMRSRFVDYPGMYVLHCHILGHEDRGMMQLVEVIDNHTTAKHH